MSQPLTNGSNYKEEEEEGASIELRFESCKKSAPPPGVRRALFPSVTKMTAWKREELPEKITLRPSASASGEYGKIAHTVKEVR